METDKLRDRYDFILGFVALVVSLSAFKDELQTIDFTFGTYRYDLGQYFLVVISGFLICLYFYSIEKISRNYSFGQLKIFSVILVTAEVLLVFLIASPLILLVAHFGFWVYSALSEIPEENLKTANATLQIVTVIVNIVVSILFFINYSRQRKEKKLKELEEDEIKDLELAERLLKDNYYSQSILESFKVLETHLYKKLTEKNVRVFRGRMNDLIKASLEYGIITNDNLPLLNDIRGMRNSAAHLDTNYTKEHAEMAIKFIKGLIKSTATNNVHMP
jgi:hypothetical protein